MKKILFLLSFTAIAFLTGCASDPASPTNNNNNNNNSSDADSYLPLTVGDSWTYQGSIGTYTVSVIGDTTFGGYTWKIISNSSAAGHGYIRKDGTQYKEMAPPGYIIAGEVMALNETPGSSWVWDANSQGIADHYVYTNAAQGLSRTVLGKNYTNVIDVRMDYTFTASGQVVGSGTFHYYYAKGIGLIDTDLGAQGDQPLSSYTLK